MTKNTALVQLFRFLRLLAAAFVVQLAAIQGQHIGRSALIAAGVAAIEVAWRQFRPVPLPAPNATAPVAPPE